MAMDDAMRATAADLDNILLRLFSTQVPSKKNIG